ncbi:uracil-DNA glycosylase family protein [Archangium lipolyticum]|uniref:uracil-DNA glycosylase family protein n=1 Tax=Archangium lipolyticum TaxID=2970465 RepID=UPI002149FD9C|nr:uracil-DNA glycosylase family protein [Archangium lipolyticum]
MPNLESDTCRNCPYHPRQGLVPSPRSGRAHVPLSAEVHGSETLLLFQAPGINEWSDGRVLSSQESRSAGQRFDTALANAGKRREDFDIAEAVNCYPGQNANGRDLTPKIGAVEACSRWLAELINEKRYTKVVLFGRVAEQSLALAWFSTPTIAHSITSIVRKQYINMERDESIAEALTDLEASEPEASEPEAPPE